MKRERWHEIRPYHHAGRKKAFVSFLLSCSMIISAFGTSGLCGTSIEASAEDVSGLGKQALDEAQTASSSPIRNVNLNIKISGEEGYRINGITDPEQPAKRTDKWALGKGSYLWAGGYWQSDTNNDGTADREDSKEPVRWRVLDADTQGIYGDGHTMLLFSDKVLDAIKYSETESERKGKANYKTSNVRLWLNSATVTSGDAVVPAWEQTAQEGWKYPENGFLSSIFSETEAGLAAKSVKKDNYSSSREDDNDPAGLSQDGISDYFFLPASWELNAPRFGFYYNDNFDYSGNYESLIQEQTDYSGKAAEALEADMEEFPTTWTRNMPGVNTGFWVYAAGEKYDGTYHCVYEKNYDEISGVAPMFNLDLSKMLFVRAASADGKTAAEPEKFSATTDCSDIKDWSPAMDTGIPFTASRDGRGNIPKGGQVKVKCEAPEKGTWDQISALFVDEDGVVAAYGKVADIQDGAVKADGGEDGEVSVTLPEELENGNYTLKVFAEKNGTKESLTSYASQTADIAVTIGQPDFHQVKVAPGKHMVRVKDSGDDSQEVKAGDAMKSVSYNAADGYYFPENYTDSVETDDSGITVKRDSRNQITVSGTPSKTVRVILPEPVWEGASAKQVSWNVKSGDGYRIEGIIDPQEPESADAEWADGRGNYVNFGSYWQRGETDKSSVKWRVLDADTTDYTDGHTMLLFSDSILQADMEMSPWSPVGRSTGSYQAEGIRAWLNSRKTPEGEYAWHDIVSSIQSRYKGAGFLEEAFNSAQCAAVAESVKAPDTARMPETPDDSKYFSGKMYLDECGLAQDGVSDRVFLLSAKDITNAGYGFYPDRNQAGASQSRILKEAETQEAGQWWLRSGDYDEASAENNHHYGYVEDDGSLDIMSGYGRFTGAAPAFNLDLSKVLYASVEGYEKGDFAPVESVIGEKTWNLTISGGDGFSAESTGNKKVAPGSKIPVSIKDIGTAIDGISYDRISAVLATDEGGVLAYGKIADVTDGKVTVGGKETTEVSVQVPEGTENGNYVLKIFAEQAGNSTETAGDTTDYASNAAEIAVVVGPGYTVKVTAGKGLVNEGNEEDMSQVVAAGETMRDITFKTADGFYLPEDYSVKTPDGIAVTRNGYTGLAVSGIPKGNVEISLPDASEKQKAAAPEGLSGGELVINGTTAAMEYMLRPENGTEGSGEAAWTACSDGKTEVSGEGVYYVRYAETETSLASETVEVTVTGEVSPIETQDPGTEVSPTPEIPGTQETDTPGTEVPGTETPSTEAPGTDGSPSPAPTEPGTVTGSPEPSSAPSTEIPSTEVPSTNTPSSPEPSAGNGGQPNPSASSSAEPGTDTKLPAKGQKIKGKDGAAYTVTKADGANSAVSYTKPKSTGITSISVPATVTVDGVKYKVTSIAANAFKNCKKLKKAVIGSNIATVGNGAFSGCAKLKNLTIGKNVTSVGARAFYKCTSLTKVTIPSKVNKIGKQAFSGCKKLKKLTFKTTKLKTKTVGAKAFAGIAKKPTAKAPKKVKKAYQKLIRAKGAKKAVVK